jgi:hypothetical protein
VKIPTLNEQEKKSSTTTDVTLNYASLTNPEQTVSFTSSSQTKQNYEVCDWDAP